MKIHQMDIKTAFLNGELTEEVYGLKQSPHCWNETLHHHLIKMKFTQTNGDPCIYVSEDAIIAVYVDDLLIAGKSDKILAKIKSEIADRFEAKDFRRATLLPGSQNHSKSQERSHLAWSTKLHQQYPSTLSYG